MAQHDYVIDNQSAPLARADINAALQAIVTQNAGASAPATTYADMFWYDTANNQIKKRNEANSAWITLGTINEATGKFDPNNSFVNNTFVPVQQGGPTGTGSNKIYLGWNTNNSGILTQVDSGGYLGRLVVNAYTTSATNNPTLLYAPGEMPLYACRAWGVCDANGNFVAGGNIAAISGLNPTTATFAVPMIDANYSVVVSGFGQESNTRYPHIRGKAAGSVAFANGGGVAGGMWFAVFQ